MPRTRGELLHGTMTAYSHGRCRCDKCREAAAAYSRSRTGAVPRAEYLAKLAANREAKAAARKRARPPSVPAPAAAAYRESECPGCGRPVRHPVGTAPGRCGKAGCGKDQRTPEIARDEPVAAKPAHVHRWRIAEPSGKESPATCTGCGASRMFSNSLSNDLYDLHAWRGQDG